jgi:hypothetical protein
MCVEIIQFVDYLFVIINQYWLMMKVGNNMIWHRMHEKYHQYKRVYCVCNKYITVLFFVGGSVKYML